MSVEYWLVFVVCQATFVQPDGITLPFTSLTYKSFPTSLKENLSSLENSGNAETPAKTNNLKDIELNSSKTSLETPLKQSLLKTIVPRSSKNASFRNNSSRCLSPDSQTKSTKQLEYPVKILSSSPNIATTKASNIPLTNLIKEEDNNIKDDSISCSYSPKQIPYTTNINYFANKKNNNIINLESPLHKDLSEANQQNIVPKLDYKQTNHEFQRHSYNTVQKLKNIQKDNLDKVKDKIDGSDILNNRKFFQTINRQTHIDKSTPECNEDIKLIENPISKILCPIDDILSNSGSNLANTNQVIKSIQAETIGEKISNNLNLEYNEDNVDLIVTPLVKLQSDKENEIDCNVEVSDYVKINKFAVSEPVYPINYAPAQTQSCGTYSCGTKDTPKVYLPNGYTSPSKMAISLNNVSPASSFKVSDSYNCFKHEITPEIVTKSSKNIPNFNPNNCVIEQYLAGINSPNIIPSIPTYYSTPSHTMRVPALSQLPGVYPSEITFSQPLSSHESHPKNVIFNDVPDISWVNLIDNRLLTSKRSNFDHHMLLPSENLNLLIPLVNNTDNIPSSQPKCRNQNYVQPLNNVFIPDKDNQPNLAPTQNVNPVTLQLSPENIPGPSKSKLTKTNLYSSPLTESLNNIISYLTTGLISAFFDLNTKSDKPVALISPDCPIIANIESDAPSYINSETSVSLAMPSHLLNPPQLPSPTFLSTPNVSPLKDCDSTSSLKRKSVGKNLKAYISSITINLIPSNDVDDIVVIV